MNLEAAYGDGTRASAAALTLDVSPAGPARFSDLFGPAPQADMLVIDRPVVLDIDATVRGMEIVAGGALTFDPARSLLLRVNARALCVEGGKLDLSPSSAAVRHEIRFVNVDEALFQPGGLGDHVTNPGLCVMDPGGTVVLKGARKRGWCRAAGPIAAAATSFTVEDATGWLPGDELVITPTEPATVMNHHTHFDRVKIASVTGNTVTVVSPLAWPHPTNTSPTGQVIAAEVVNLTRNVIVSGDTENGVLGATRTNGRAQIMFMAPQLDLTMSHVELRHLGPRQVPAGKSYTEVVTGRYGLHWHRMGDATRGILVEGVSAHDLGSRAFVPHASHGITFRDCAAWGYFDAGYWWDQDDTTLDATDDLTYQSCFAGYAKHDTANGLGGIVNTGFMLAAGSRMSISGCAAAAITGRTNASGYHWPSKTNLAPNNVWDFHDNDVHNCQVDGTFVWQNDDNDHSVIRLRTWNNTEAGVDHGAYKNAYRYVDLQAWGNLGCDFMEEAQSWYPTNANPVDAPVKITGGHIGKLTIGKHSVSGNAPVLFRDVEMGSVSVNEIGTTCKPGSVDVVNCGVTPAQVTRILMVAGSVLRIQQAGQAWQITATQVTPIPVFG